MLLIENVVHLDAPVDLLIDGDKIVSMTPVGHCEYSGDCPRFSGGGLLLHVIEAADELLVGAL
ncbi:MAG: hypothetical protein HDQ93_01045 [Desulfovibrio sp.]|nr:hypothetical protein [Desulfovibrio sp.]